MTLGPPALVFNWPETASMASRISSACNRRRSNRQRDRKSTRLNSSHGYISYAVFCLKKKKHTSELQSRLHLVCRLLLEKKKEDANETRGRNPATAPTLLPMVHVVALHVDHLLAPTA